MGIFSLPFRDWCPLWMMPRQTTSARRPFPRSVANWLCRSFGHFIILTFGHFLSNLVTFGHPGVQAAAMLRAGGLRSRAAAALSQWGAGAAPAVLVYCLPPTCKAARADRHQVGATPPRKIPSKPSPYQAPYPLQTPQRW
eukprot:295599-Prorocentrum_minimum.AAC.1